MRPDAGPVRAPTSRRGILETKILAPRRTHPLVARPRLIERLTAESEIPLVGVIGPAGYGKTTLLSQLAASDRRAVAWLTVDERDADPMVLLPLRGCCRRPRDRPARERARLRRRRRSDGLADGPLAARWRTRQDTPARAACARRRGADRFRGIVRGHRRPGLVAAGRLAAGPGLTAGRWAPGSPPGRGRDDDPDRTGRALPRRCRGGRVAPHRRTGTAR